MAGFEDLAAGIQMSANDVPIIASSVFDNCGWSVASTDDKAILNSEVRVGPNTKWALPSGSNGFIEGCTVAVAADGTANKSATLFAPGKLPDARDARTGGSSMMLIANTLATLPGGLGVAGPLGPTSTGHPQPAAQWTLVDNLFEDAALSSWSKAALVLIGEGTNSSCAISLVDKASLAGATPQSQLLFGGDGW